MALPVSPEPTERRAAVLRMLSASPEGLSDAALARELGGGVRTQTVNQLCRRLAAEGELERVGTRPILNRLPAPKPRRGRRTTGAGSRTKRSRTVAAVPSSPDTADTAAPPAAATDPLLAGASPSGTDASPATEPPTTADPVVAAPNASGTGASPASDPVPQVAPETRTRTTAEPTTSPGYDPPPYDALQAWSRVVNVQSLVAGWLVRRGATLRRASADGTGPARDLVASLDGDDVHVEVTGWPADGARTHPTTIAGDWFSAAEHAAAERRRAHPRARIVIALPDTRRYRSLTEQRAASLAGAGTEVWFVDAAGSVHAR